MKKIIVNIIKFVLFFGVGFVILYYVFKGAEKAYLEQCEMDFMKACLEGGSTESACRTLLANHNCSFIDKIINDFRNANYFWIAMVMTAFLLSNVSRALRWNMLIKPLGYNARFFNTFWATMAGYFANMALPRMGEVVKPGLVARYEGVPLEKLMGTIVVDRLMDVLCLALVMGLAFSLQFDVLWTYVSENAFQDSGGESTGTFGIVLWILGGIAVAGLVGLFIFRKRIMASTFYEKLKNIVLGFWEGIKTVFKLDNTPGFIAHSVFIWLMYFTMTWLCFFAFEPTSDLTMMIGLVVFVFGSLGIVIPSPGGMGSYNYLVTAALMIYGLNQNDAFSFSLIAFVTISACNVIFGLIGFIVLPIWNQKFPVKQENSPSV
ncbi:MAG: lysylphosphatidylglycerol synthase transmembrane domain-containing protein [Bacteroidota bacterium]